VELFGRPLSIVEHFAVAGIGHAVSGPRRPDAAVDSAASTMLFWCGNDSGSAAAPRSHVHGDWSCLAVVSLMWPWWLLLSMRLSGYVSGDRMTTTFLGDWQVVIYGVVYCKLIVIVAGLSPRRFL
jgi:hypothetical protein